MIRTYARIKGSKTLATFAVDLEPTAQAVEKAERDTRWALRRELVGPVLAVIDGGKGQRPSSPAGEPEAA